jgi:hypothetical protein
MKHSPSIRDPKEKNRGIYGARGSILASESPKFIVNIIGFLRYFYFSVIHINILIIGTSQQT